MKFIIDAQLPLQLAQWLVYKGYDAVHTLQLPEKNLTDDTIVIQISMEQERIVISKDSDFYDNFILKGQPYKLLMVTTGNIVNKELLQLFQNNFEQLKDLLINHQVIELNNETIIVHY
jgi:predicted nuclease of predicted toxin-antitoxin system